MKIKTLILLILAGVLIGPIFILGKNKNSSNESGYQVAIPSSQLKVNLAAAADTAQITVQKGNTKISFATPLRGTTLEKKSEEFVYKDKKGAMEIRYRPIPKGIKEEIVLKQQLQTNKFNIKVTLNDAVLGKNLDGQPVVFDKNSKYQFHFQKPYAQDAKGEKTENLSYTWTNSSDESNLLLTLVVDQAWLSDPKRAYPIIIDPTIIDNEKEAKPEVIAKRTLTSNTYDLGNGKFATTAVVGPVNYYDPASNSYKEINETIVASDDPLYNFMVKEGIHRVYFKTNPSTSQTVKFYYDSQIASPNLLEKNPKKTGYTTFQPMSLNFRNDLNQIQQTSVVRAVIGAPSATNTFSYPNVFGNGLNLNYDYLKTMLLEKLIINEFSNLPNPEQYILDGQNVTLDLDEVIDWADNLDIYINGKLWDKKTTISTTERIEFRDGGAVLFFIPPAYAWDSSEPRNEILLTQQFKKQGNKLYVIKKTPYSWLSDPGRVYPVFIDATHTYVVNDTDAQGYKGADVNGGFNNNESEFTSSEYSYIAVDDNNYVFQTYSSRTKKYYAYMRFDFTINENIDDINQIDVTWKGKGGIAPSPSFLGDTQVKTPDGDRSFGELYETYQQQGNLPLIFYLEEGKIRQGHIENVIRHSYKGRLLILTFSNQKEVKVTPDHLILIDGIEDRYLKADELAIGTELPSDEENKLVLIKKESVDFDGFVYDLKVEEYHNFLLEAGFFAHNDDIYGHSLWVKESGTWTKKASGTSDSKETLTAQYTSNFSNIISSGHMHVGAQSDYSSSPYVPSFLYSYYVEVKITYGGPPPGIKFEGVKMEGVKIE